MNLGYPLFIHRIDNPHTDPDGRTFDTASERHAFAQGLDLAGNDDIVWTIIGGQRVNEYGDLYFKDAARTVHCPHCDGQALAETQRALVTMQVGGFIVDDDGNVRVETGRGEPTIDWMNADPVDYPYNCLDCGAVEMDADDLIVKRGGVEVSR